MGRRNLFAGCCNGSKAAQKLTKSPGGQRPTTETADAAGEEVLETPGALTKPIVSFAAAHADGRPQRALPQKPKLKSLNLGKSIKNENELCILEEWDTRENLNSHLKSERFGVLRGAMNLLKEPYEMLVHTVTAGNDRTKTRSQPEVQ